MKLCTGQLLLLLAAVCNLADAAAPKPYSDNFRVVLDNNSAKKDGARLMVKRNNILPDSVDFNELYQKVQTEAMEILTKVRDEVTAVVEKVETQAKELVDHMKHYTKKEVGMYAALTVAMTVALKSLVFNSRDEKTVDIAGISYILNSPAARATYAKIHPVKELSRPSRKLRLVVSPSISSRDSKTYRNTIPKIPKHASKVPPPPPSSPAQVVVNTVTAFYEEHEVVPASHNAVLKTMTPAMRHRLRARRIRGGEVPKGLVGQLLIGFYFVAWYALNVMYNIVNKNVLNVLPAPLTVGSFQFLVGGLYCALIWAVGLRPMPRLTPEGRKAVTSVGFYHSLGQLASIVSLGAGPVSFTHIVKAMEPFFSAIVSGFYFKKWMPAPVYATLLPVVGGVGYACMKELNFSWLAFSSAMASNLLFALRAVMSKLALQSGKAAGSNLSPPNMFGLVTWAAFLISVPIALWGEGGTFLGLWKDALDAVDDKKKFIRSVVISGLLHYLNNEVMYLALGSVHPVTLAVGNTMKRVFILVASVMVFRNPVTPQAAIGSGIGIAGVLLYSLTKQYYETTRPEPVKITGKKIMAKSAKVAPAMKAAAAKL